jgi:hypothetical protein
LVSCTKKNLAALLIRLKAIKTSKIFQIK